jgi:ligand-binding SRPBCC domain-containing protein
VPCCVGFTSKARRSTRTRRRRNKILRKGAAETMTEIQVVTEIAAPVERCFDLARDLTAHTETTGTTRERVIEGPPSGMMGAGDIVTFEAVHFGVRQRLTARVVEFDPPHQFVDEQVKGAFRSMRHVHRFEAAGGGTRMVDELRFAAPLGPLGWLAERLFLRTYMRRFLRHRGQELRRLAEHPGEPPSPL